MKLNFYRIAMLLRIELHTLLDKAPASFLAILLLTSAGTWLGAVKYHVVDIHQVIFNTVLCLSAALVSSGCFYQFANRTTKQEYLALPAYPLEKFISKVVLVVPLYLLALFAGYYVIAHLVNIGFSAFGVVIETFEPFNHDTIALLTVILALQGLFVLGSVVFDRHALVRTLMVSAVVTIVLALLVYICLLIAYADNFVGWKLVEKIRFNGRFANELLPALSYTAFFYLLPIISWCAAAITLQKKEL